MSEANEPKKETVRIKLPSRQEAGGSSTNGRNRYTVRINLPPRAPNNVSSDFVGPKPPSIPPPPLVLPGLGEVPKAPAFPMPSIVESVPSPVHSPSISEDLAEAPLPSPPPLPIAKAPTTPIAKTPTTPIKEAPVPVAKAPTPLLSSSSSPKKETARIVTNPQPRPSTPRVKMSKTQPLITAPEPEREMPPISVAPPRVEDVIESIPISLCWALLAVSALLFIVQLWTYLS